MHYLKRAVVTAAATGALAAIAVPAWASAGPSATPSAAPTAVTSVPPSATPSAVPTPVTSVPPSATPSAVPTPVTSSAPGDAQPSAGPELAHTGGSSATTAAIGAGAAGLVVLGAGTLFVVRRRALR
ncbi:LAETG motif-containing sortase-dependent surface protein [Streptomyces peucetius]